MFNTVNYKKTEHENNFMLCFCLFRFHRFTDNQPQMIVVINCGYNLISFLALE